MQVVHEGGAGPRSRENTTIQVSDFGAPGRFSVNISWKSLGVPQPLGKGKRSISQ
jgi:hypothetical protein